MLGGVHHEFRFMDVDRLYADWVSYRWISGVLFTRKKFEKELKENPPINEKMIRAMFLQMGRKPSEAQIKQIMKSVNANR